MRRLVAIALLLLAASTSLHAQSSASSPGSPTPTAASIGSIGPVINVLNYGYVADWRTSLADGTCSGGSAVIGSASAAFTQVDVGKHIVMYVSGGAILAGADRTIASVQSATAATLSNTLASCGASGTYLIEIFTDNGTALNNAEKACVSAGTGTVTLPSGDAGVVSTFWNNETGTSRCSYIGQGISFNAGARGVTDIHISPWTPFTGNQIMVFQGTMEMRDIMFDGDNSAWPNVANNTIFTVSGPSVVEHVSLRNFAFANNTDGVCAEASNTAYALDLECTAPTFPGPGGFALKISSNNFTCVSCVAFGNPGILGVLMNSSRIIGGQFAGLGNNIAISMTGSVGASKSNVMTGASILTTGTSNATAAVVYATGATLDLQNVIIDNQGVSSVIAANVPAAMTVPIPTWGGIRQQGAGTTEIINVVGSLRDEGGNDNFTITGGGQLIGLQGSSALVVPCAAVGSAASPSVAACGTANSGLFSCATNATGATCQVNATGVTASSVINVIEDDTTTTGTKLGVTCNTSTTVTPTARLVASATAGTGFVLNMGTITTNPACFGYTITN